MTESRVGAEVAAFLDWCELLDESAARQILRWRRSVKRDPGFRAALVEQRGAGVPASFTSALFKGVETVRCRLALLLVDDAAERALVQTSVHSAAQAIYQRGRLSVGSYLVLTEPFRVAGFDFEDGWGVGPHAEGVVTAAAVGGSGSDGGGGSG